MIAHDDVRGIDEPLNSWILSASAVQCDRVDAGRGSNEELMLCVAAKAEV